MQVALAENEDDFKICDARIRSIVRYNFYMAQQKEVISTINGLIETLKDGQKGFKEAAEAVKDPQLKSLFDQYSQQRLRFATELQNQAKSLGEAKPEKTSSTAGAMHRAWINLKSAV